VLLGREAEKGTLARLVAAAADGISGALVLYGDVGMGKTTLLGFAAEVDPDIRFAKIAGIETENQLPFAGLHRLLLPFLGGLDDLPSNQRNALTAAFGLSDQRPADVFLVGLATLSLLAVYAIPKGLLCVIDDAQWLDPESLQALTFVARRLMADRTAMIFGFRGSSGISTAFAGIPSMEISGLEESAALQLLSLSVPSFLNSQVARRIVAETNGCPLALIELAEELSAGQWVGADPLLEPVPIGRRLEEHYYRRTSTLPAGARTFLLVAAAEPSGDRFLVRKVAADLGCGPDAESLVIREQLLTVEPQVLFRHPLIRSAVYSGADIQDRRAVHLALASAIDRATDPDRRARHLAAITSGPDPELADEFESAAHRARERGGFAAEASLLAQSAEFTEDPRLRSRRFIDSATAALDGGSVEQAGILLARARQRLIDPLILAEAQNIDGRLRIALLQPTAAQHLLSAARQFLPLDMDRARNSLLEAIVAYFVSQTMAVGTDSRELAEMALTSKRNSSEAGLADLLLESFGMLCGVGYAEAVEVLRRTARWLSAGPVSKEEVAAFYMFGIFLANELLDDRMYASWVERVEMEARESGALLALQYILICAAENQLRTGRFSAAESNFAEVAEITVAIGGPDIYTPLNAVLLAWRGDEQGTRSATTLLIEGANAIGSAGAAIVGYRALSILAMGAGRYREALQAAQESISLQTIGWLSEALPIVIEAASRCGEHHIAERALRELTDRAKSTATPWALGVLARCRALLADDMDAETLYEEAITNLEQTPLVVELAWTNLIYGEWLRRQNRRMEARTRLRAAHHTFESIGATGFAGRARAELLATGEHIRRRSVETRNELTDQELRIARLASEGATNPEIAGRLFLSASTIDYHLKKVYRKLGITSRRQLHTLLPADPDAYTNWTVAVAKETDAKVFESR
jgi:DNA-binding CsgD family transcriptional regulator